MTGLVIDASVAVKWLVNEVHSDNASALLTSGDILTAPELIYAEVGNALWAMTRRNRLSIDDCREAVALFVDAPIVISKNTKDLLPAATRLAHDLNHPIYDCLYLALAVQEERSLVTADDRFAQTLHAHPYLAKHLIPLRDMH